MGGGGLRFASVALLLRFCEKTDAKYKKLSVLVRLYSAVFKLDVVSPGKFDSLP